jgi:N-acetylglucosaminyldiphosphoundecaprenol N-acetyl-beta-D-mannosaminyltransferase
MDENKMSCFLFGGENEDVARRIIKRMKEDFRNIEIVGYFTPPFVEEFKGAIKEKIQIVINRKKPDVVWVGLSAPKQEKWIYDNIRRLDAKMVCGIGAVFNFYSGRVKRAPKWIQKMGFEWLFRIFAEPRRLFKKYIVYNAKFTFLVLKDIFRRIFKLGSLKDKGKLNGPAS